MRLRAVLPLVLFAACATAPDTRIRRYSTPESVAANTPYSDAVQTGNLIFVSGKMGFAPGQREPLAGGVQAETKQALDNIRTTLEANRATMGDVVKCTVILADIADWDAMNIVYRTYFPTDKPARTTFGSAGLVRNGRVEIECIAAVRGR